MRNLLAAVAVVCLFAGAPALAQTSNSTLGGTVADSTGALIPGVTITATNTETGIINTTVTNESGVYHFPSLQAGIYSVAASLPGFQTQVAKALKLEFSQQARFNFTMQTSTLATTVEVSVATENLLASSSSVGMVLPEYKVTELPLANRDVLALTATMAGVVQGNQTASFAGSRTGAVQTMVNGIAVNDGRYQTGVYSATQLSPDLVSEIRIIVSPADAETGRGSGQVQVSTRSGTNAFRGSLFYTNHNSALDSNTWFNNFNGVKTDYSNRNQFGGRFGGPILRNKTFFFFVYDGQRTLQRTNVDSPVYTEQARQGLFRYFPGAQNANALAANPTVDVLGNPVRPAAATGPLATVNVFTRDPNRPVFDPFMNSLLAKMPLPNNWTTGDGLNTANYHFARRESGAESPFSGAVDVNRDQFNFRVDHNFNSKHKLFFTYSHEHVWADSQLPAWPGGVSGKTVRYPAAYTSSIVSTISPNVINEFRFGLRNGSQRGYAAYDRLDIGEQVVNDLPKTAAGVPYIPRPLTFPNHLLTYTVGSRVQSTPLYQYADTISWTRGRHAFKGGVEIRFGSSKSQQGSQAMPLANFGAGGVPVQGMTTIAGLASADQTGAQNLLINLSGSLAAVNQSFFLNSSSDLAFQSWSEMPKAKDSPDGFPPGKIRNNHQREMSGFFKDDWKVTRSLTLNLGVRWDYYGVPWEDHGLFGSPANNGGNGAGVFGISGTSFDDLFQPGRAAGAPTTIELVGKKSPNPNKQIYKDDYNNFGPAIGLSWSVPWFGPDKTMLRAGYGISYTGGGYGIVYDYTVNGAPGANDDEAFQSPTLLTLSNITLPTRGVPFGPVGFNDRTKGVEAFDSNFVSPYVQNWNLEIQRNLTNDLSFAVRYIGSKGTKLQGEVATNEVNIFENGILDAFNITRTGGNAALFNSMLMGLTVPGAGTVNGTTLTGSQAFRISTSTRAFLANGDVGAFAAFLNNSVNFTTTGAGGIVRNAGLPENFITGNPQFSTANPGTTTLPGNATFITNISDSTYHSMQLEVSKRLSHGFAAQATYTWSHSLGIADDDGGLIFRTLRNRNLNKGPLGFDRRHQITSNGTFMLPFGPNRALLSNAHPIVLRLVENWQLSGILNWTAGAPLTLTGVRSSFNSTNEGPMLLGALPSSTGKVTITSSPGVVTYFDGFGQVVDPAKGDVTTANTLSSSNNEMAITDPSGNIVLVNPAPGQLSNMSRGYFRGPSALRFDMGASKRIRLSEVKSLEFRMDAINVLNHPNWGVPNVNINSTSFGRITTATGNRSFTGNIRLNF